MIDLKESKEARNDEQKRIAELKRLVEKDVQEEIKKQMAALSRAAFRRAA